MNVELIKFDFEYSSLRDLFNKAWKDAGWTLTYPTVQSAIQTRENQEDDFFSTCKPGTLSKDEKEFTSLNGLYRDTYLEELIESIPFKVCRMRWMVLFPKSCYSLHRDGTRRLHIPIKTNDQCFLIFEGGGTFHNLREGAVYITDTRKNHTAINGGLEIRVHLVGCLYD